MSDDAGVELPQLWRFIHPHYDEQPSDEDEESADEEDEVAASNTQANADYVKLSRKAPQLGKLMRYLNDFEEPEELQQVLLEKDPVTQQTLLQWAALHNHFLLVEYLVKLLQRGAFSFDGEAPDVVVYDRWEEMRPELPSAAGVAERQRAREQEKAKRRAEMLASGDAEDEEEDMDEEEEEAEPTPEELVYESLDDLHDELGDNGVGMVKRIGELGVYLGSRLRDGTKQGIGQTLYPNGDCYAGDYVENQRSGKGTYWWRQNGGIYTGDWVKDARHGYGRMCYPDGSRYLGHWAHDKKNGTGRYVYPDGSSYDGSWEDNCKHGSGTYSFTDGSAYTGSFYKNNFVSGEWLLASGTVRYIGNFDQDVPQGAGVYVHRCGDGDGSFQQEGRYEKGQWVPTMMKGSTRVVPRLEMIAPLQKHQRVPIQFSPACADRTIHDLVKVANYAPLVGWVSSLAGQGVSLVSLEVAAMAYEPAMKGVVAEATVKPVMADAEGKRVRLPGDEEVLRLRTPKTRLMVLLEPADAAADPLLVVEEEGARLPEVRVDASGTVTGACVKALSAPLRLELSSSGKMLRLLQQGEENVLLYAQQVHPSTWATLPKKLEGTPYTTLPLSDAEGRTQDTVTAAAVGVAQQRRAEHTLPCGTTQQQRPPTPLPPAAQPRPDLQPLYAAKARRDEAEAEDEEEAEM